MIRVSFALNIIVVAAFLLVAVATDGVPPFWLYVGVLALVLCTHQVLNPNLNAAAMRPLAHVAGTGAAMIGMLSGVGGSVLAGLIDDQFDGTVRPQAIAFALASVVAAVSWRFAERAQRGAQPVS